jgi:DNA-binding beta-propeller fold protein YncE
MKKRLGISLALALTTSLAACGSQEKTCAADQRLCANACVSLSSDAQNCGACGHACGAAQGCSAGACVDCATSNGACTAEVVVACGDLDQARLLRADLSLANAPLATDSRPVSFARVGTKVYVANSTSSTISTIGLSPPSSAAGSASFPVSSGNAGFADLEYIAAHNGLLWTSNSAANTLVVVDPATGKPVDELTLPLGGSFGANPQGIDFIGNKGYVALAGMNAVGVIDATAVPGARIAPATIDLTPLAAPGAQALPSRVLAVGTRAYVTLNDVDANFNTVPGANGRLAVIDSATDAVVGPAVDLGSGCLNPSGMALSGTTLWVGCGFHLFNSSVVTGGALVPVDVSSGTPAVGAPIALSTNAAGSIAFCSGRGYAGATESGTVIAFDPAAHAVSGSGVACPANPGKGSAVFDLACAQ